MYADLRKSSWTGAPPAHLGTAHLQPRKVSITLTAGVVQLLPGALTQLVDPPALLYRTCCPRLVPELRCRLQY